MAEAQVYGQMLLDRAVEPAAVLEYLDDPDIGGDRGRPVRLGDRQRERLEAVRRSGRPRCCRRRRRRARSGTCRVRSSRDVEYPPGRSENTVNALAVRGCYVGISLSCWPTWSAGGIGN